MSAGILYLHGFCSSPASAKSRLLAATLQARGQGERFFCPALSHVPLEAIAQAQAIITAHAGPLTVVGSSLGGYYATWLAEEHNLRAVLINPAVVAPLSLNQYIGIQTNLHTGQAFDFTAEHIAQLRGLEVESVRPERYFLLVETGDEVLDYRKAVARYAGCRQKVLAGGDHSFTRFADLLPELIEYCGL